MNKFLFLLFTYLLFFQTLRSQSFDDNVKKLMEKSFAKSSNIKINNYKIEQSQTDRQIAKNSYIPRVSANATYTRLNDDIVFPSDLQTLLLGTQQLLIKEKLGLGFNIPLPSTVSLKNVDPIQKKDIFKITGNAQMLLYSGNKVPMVIKATEHQEKEKRY